MSVLSDAAFAFLAALCILDDEAKAQAEEEARRYDED